MLDDLGNPSAKAIGRALGVSERTAYRWIAQDQAPRAAGLALFWLTRWGQSQVLCDAERGAVLHRQWALSLKAENLRLRAALAAAVPPIPQAPAEKPATGRPGPALRLISAS